MEALLEAQAEFLKQQEKFADDKVTRKKKVHLAQLKELEERSRLLKLQEVQNEELKTQKTLQEEKKQKLRPADSLEKWYDNDQPDAYISRFETVMAECEVPREQWRGRLVNCLIGWAVTAYQSIALGGESTAYEDMHDKLLVAMGLG